MLNDNYFLFTDHIMSNRLLTRYGYKWMLFLKMDRMKLLLLLFVR